MGDLPVLYREVVKGAESGGSLYKNDSKINFLCLYGFLPFPFMSLVLPRM